ncbi:hypothetical protein A2801_00620 [Candidatus Woesebacteria bacterium RIFCSPHIGHO2_01_FULL_41_10]|uniref:Uncharacterized protein n=1 Tax=Candidatus Woesebacteria bacterium RIFCSPHIGHO2_01_FULL_41_10 TaxID=1802500 RepID=A0A1F7YR48_9BACT|nr:MAG: hypothetical protein A2801_00620 [Candidatus Woesebacteria bacterium RIFCSPHIGHO2_01_FULL_41_10]
MIKDDTISYVTNEKLDQAVDTILKGVDNLMKELRKEVRQEISEIRKEVNELREEMKQEFSFVRNDVKGLHAELSDTPSGKEFKDLKAKVYRHHPQS